MRKSIGIAATAALVIGLGAIGGAPPAQAAPPLGFFYSTVTIDAAETYATNGAVTMTRTAPGRYTFVADNLGGSGTPQLTVWDTGERLPVCMVSSVLRRSADTRIQVRCNHPDTLAGRDAVFSLLYSSLRTSDAARHHASVVTQSVLNSTPSNQFRSHGTGAIKVKRLGVGRFRVRIPDETFPTNGGVVLTTATGASTRYCNPQSWSNNGFGGTDVFVNCYRADGTLASSTFSLLITEHTAVAGLPGGSAWSYHVARNATHFNVGPLYKYNSSGGAVTHADQVAPGSSEVKFAGVFTAGTPAKLAVNYGAHRCAHQGLHGLFGADLVFAVACQTAAGAPVDTSYDLVAFVLPPA